MNVFTQVEKHALQEEAVFEVVQSPAADAEDDEESGRIDKLLSESAASIRHSITEATEKLQVR